MKTLTPEEVKTIIQNAPQGSNPNVVVEALVQKGYILQGLNDQPQPQKEGFLKSAVKDVAETLVVKPVARATEAATRVFAPNSLAAKGYEEMADKGESQRILGIDVEAQKGGIEGAKQIAGETLKIGSFLFPYGKVAQGARGALLGASKLTPKAIKTAKIAGQTISGATGGYLADVGYDLADNKTLGQALKPGVGTIFGAGIPLASAGIKAGSKALKGTKTSKDVTKRVIQGETKDIPLAEQAFKNIDLKGVKSRQELSDRLAKAMESQMSQVDDFLAKDPRALSLDEYAQRATNKAGQEVKTDFISKALNDLEEFYKKAGDDLSASNVNLVKQKAVSEGLTHQEVNNISRLYSEEFGSKAFNKVGDPLTNVNAQMYENTRNALKQASRGGLGYGAEARQADRLYSAMANTKRLIDKGVEGVNRLEGKLKDRNILQKLSYGAVKVINALTGGVLKSGVEALGVSNVGNKIDNWVNLERSLQKDLMFIEKANKLKSDSALIKAIEDFSKRIKFPGDKAAEDISKRVKTGKEILKKKGSNGGFIKLPLNANKAKNAIDDEIASNIDSLISESNIPKKGKIDINTMSELEDIKNTVTKGKLSSEQRLRYNEIAKKYKREDLIPQFESDLKGKGTIPENSLIQEARKYKSAEEFVDAKVMNNARPQDAEILREFGLTPASTKADFNAAIRKEQNRLTEKFGGVNLEGKAATESRLLDLQEIRDKVVDGRYIPYTKSQLTDIWNKANKK